MICAINEPERNDSDYYFSDRAHDEGPHTLLAHFLQVRAKTYTCERKQKGPTREIPYCKKLGL
jgi:hypothetical protein